jgi:hypothetical protein
MEKNSVNGYNKQKFPNENHQIWADFKWNIKIDFSCKIPYWFDLFQIFISL